MKSVKVGDNVTVSENGVGITAKIQAIQAGGAITATTTNGKDLANVAHRSVGQAEVFWYATSMTEKLAPLQTSIDAIEIADEAAPKAEAPAKKPVASEPEEPKKPVKH